jgi:hypothetical protein
MDNFLIGNFYFNNFRLKNTVIEVGRYAIKNGAKI